MNTPSGDLYIISAPSGAGKTSLVNALLKVEDNLMLSISCTTRQPRAEEVDGKSYHFLTTETFEQRVTSGDFLEHAQVFGNFYATSKEWVLQKIQQGTDVILEIDWQGAKIIKQAMPDAVSIFILPPTLATLKARLTHRKQDTPNVILQRFTAARDDIEHYVEFEFIIVNDNFDQAVKELQTILACRRLMRTKQQQRKQIMLEKLLKKE